MPGYSDGEKLSGEGMIFPSVIAEKSQLERLEKGKKSSDVEEIQRGF